MSPRGRAPARAVKGVGTPRDRRSCYAIAVLLPRHQALAAACGLAAGGCRPARRGDDDRRVVFAHQPLGGDVAPFHGLLRAFEERHPGTTVVSYTLPNASDLAHQVFLTSLEGGSDDLDLLVVDVVWVAELARAGWIADLSAELPPATVREAMLEGAAASVIVDGRTWAIPWYVDVGLLYRRADLVPDAPRTFDALDRAVEVARRVDPAMAGFVWQGRQYEGLVCNAYEAIWAHGGDTFADDGRRLALDTPEARAGVARLRTHVERGTSPRAVATMAEEDARRQFQGGGAVFMRNWPYAWTEAGSEGSPVRGRVAISPLPSRDGTPGAGALGGYHLAINAHAPPGRRALAVGLAWHLAEHDAGLTLARAYGRNPARRSVYDDRQLRDQAPGVAAMQPLLARARPRPVTPYYPMLTDTLQAELSAVVAGLRPADAALRRAQAFADRVMGVEGKVR